jgi:tRNA/tmRNA/rRNA uracil-C5-methylase (TrmA/RlmC/RlmD family)
MRYQPRYLCCISCAVDTLARDLKPLMAAGYRPVSMRMFDMFPRTPYFESMVLLEATD